MALASAAPQFGHQQQYSGGHHDVIPIVRQSQDVSHDGSYQFRYVVEIITRNALQRLLRKSLHCDWIVVPIVYFIYLYHRKFYLVCNDNVLHCLCIYITIHTFHFIENRQYFMIIINLLITTVNVYSNYALLILRFFSFVWHRSWYTLCKDSSSWAIEPS